MDLKDSQNCNKRFTHNVFAPSEKWRHTLMMLAVGDLAQAMFGWLGG